MYIRPIHAELDVKSLHAFIKENALGLLITHIDTDSSIAPLQATHIPFVIDPPKCGFGAQGEGEQSREEEVDLGWLRGHVARANPHAKALVAWTKAERDRLSASAMTSTLRPSSLFSYFSSSDNPKTPSSTPPHPTYPSALLIFQSPNHSYLSPQFYTSTKPSTGKVVPTWNYQAVQVYGELEVHFEGEEADEFLQKQVEDLTDQQEMSFVRKKQEGKAKTCPIPEGNAALPFTDAAPGCIDACSDEGTWKVSDAPATYTSLLRKSIIGICLRITRIEGRFKLSQESGLGDVQGVVDGFRGMGGPEGERMAGIVESANTDRLGKARDREEK